MNNDNIPKKKKPPVLMIVGLSIIGLIVGLIILAVLGITAMQYADIQHIIAESKEQTADQMNAEARGYLIAAERITKKYIIPSGIKKGAYKNAKTWIYKFRDDLYEKGMNKLAPDDGEREIWWWNVRYQEFENAYGKFLSTIYKGKEDVPEKSEHQKLKEWDKEILAHIKSFPDATPKDKSLLKFKYTNFIMMLQDYVYRTVQINDYFEFLTTDEKTRAQKMKTILEEVDKSYLYYKSFVNQKEKEGVEYQNGKHTLKLEEIEFREHIARELVGNYERLDLLDCNNRYFDIFTDSTYEKLAYVKVHRKQLSFQDQYYFGAYFSGIIGSRNFKTSEEIAEFEKFCSNKPGFQKYMKFRKEWKEKRYSKNPNTINPDNRLYQLTKD
jgi:hypothetical protein